MKNNYPAIDLDLLAQLTHAPGISGREDEIRELIIQEITPYVDSVETDALGNVIGQRVGAKPSIMLEAHMDEVGFMVSGIDSSGFVNFLPVGPILEPLVLGQRLCIHTREGAFQGVVGYGQAFDGERGVRFKDLYLDTGYAKDDIESIVKVGDAITYVGDMVNLGNGLIAGKAMDNRTGVLVLLETARRIQHIGLDRLNREVNFCFSVRHEVGALGISSLVSKVQPDQAIVVDVALASDYPHELGGRLGQTDLNEGPVLWRGVDLSEAMVSCIEHVAKENKIKCQQAAWNRFTPTNASHIMTVGPAVQTTLLSIPHRYPHGPNSMVSINDIENLIKLMSLFLAHSELLNAYKR